MRCDLVLGLDAAAREAFRGPSHIFATEACDEGVGWG